MYTKMEGVPISGFRKYWTQKLASLNSQCHAITKKCPEAGSVVQQVHKVLNEIETLTTCTPASVEESPEWTSIVNFCKSLDGKPLFSVLDGMYTVTLNEMKAVSAQCSEQNLIGTNGPG
jgi:hypothetical protein